MASIASRCIHEPFLFLEIAGSSAVESTCRPHDPARVADTKAWMARAASDLGAGAHELTAVPPFTADAVFHAQQAAEKALEGFLAWHDVPFGKTHDLAALGRLSAEIDRALGANREVQRKARFAE